MMKRVMLSIVTVLILIVLPVTVAESIKDVAADDIVPPQDEGELARKLSRVNGIELTDGPADVIAKHGEPLQIMPDPLLQDMYTYVYDRFTVVFSNDYIQYVEVTQAVGSLTLGEGSQLDMSRGAVLRTLGEPMVWAEDGFVYCADLHCMKFYYDQTDDLGSNKPHTNVSNRQIGFVHYFHLHAT